MKPMMKHKLGPLSLAVWIAVGALASGVVAGCGGSTPPADEPSKSSPPTTASNAAHDQGSAKQ